MYAVHCFCCFLLKPVFVASHMFDRLWLSEFPTSKLEMEKVADIFDKDRDGFINYKEFVAALRPDRDVSAAVAAKYRALRQCQTRNVIP